MLSPNLERILDQISFENPDNARRRMDDLAGDQAEALALARLSDHLLELLLEVPDCDLALNNFVRIVQSRGSRWQLYQFFLDHPAGFDAFVRVISSSKYLGDVLVRNPEYIDIITDRAVLIRQSTFEDYSRELEGICHSFKVAPAMLNAIRRYQRREILRIGAADMLGFFDLATATHQISVLADAIVSQCLLIVSNGNPPSGFFVLALGKLGGDELNYSSDIDLIFVTDPISPPSQCMGVAMHLTQSLSDFTSEGFLYRIDLRLRPYGSSGSLVVSTDMLSQYLEKKAHPAERQAMLKARAIAGARELGEEFLASLHETLHTDAEQARVQVYELKQRIERQLTMKRTAEGNVKLAPGGIRDIEFLVQALQLEDGRSEVQSRNTMHSLTRLRAVRLLSEDETEQLRAAYVFLRNLEHRLQLMDNQQIHQLPKQTHAVRVLARSMSHMGVHTIDEMNAALSFHMKLVRSIFDRIVGGNVDG